MKKPILLLQFRTNSALEHEKLCIEQKGNFSPNEIVSINILDPESQLPTVEDLNEYSGVILGGSGEVNISEWDDETKNKIEEIKPLVLKIVEEDVPSLFICLGHQLLAYYLGSEVEPDPEQKEVGTIKIKLNQDGKKSTLFKGIPENFYVVEGHKESVMSLPKNAKLLASSDRCHIQAMQFGNNVFTTQFHAELDKEGLFERLNLFPGYLENRSKDEIMKDFKEIPYATKILGNWKELVYNHINS